LKRTDHPDHSDVEQSIRRLPGEIRQILEKRLELFALDVSEGVSIIFSRILFIIFGSISIGIASLFLLMSLSYYLGNLLDNTALGYAITAVPLLLFGLLLFYQRPIKVYNKVKTWLMHQFIELISRNKME
jgi:uncharacterized membrane protein YqjE